MPGRFKRTERDLRRQPVVVGAAVPRVVHADPAVVRVVDAFAGDQRAPGGVEAIWKGDAGGVNRLCHRVPARLREYHRRGGVIEPAGVRKSAEVVIE